MAGKGLANSCELQLGHRRDKRRRQMSGHRQFIFSLANFDKIWAKNAWLALANLSVATGGINIAGKCLATNNSFSPWPPERKPRLASFCSPPICFLLAHGRQTHGLTMLWKFDFPHSFFSSRWSRLAWALGIIPSFPMRGEAPSEVTSKYNGHFFPAFLQGRLLPFAHRPDGMWRGMRTTN